MKKLELEVDFIGGQEPLTPEEEKALSDFFKQRKSVSLKLLTKKQIKTTKQLKQLPNTSA